MHMISFPFWHWPKATTAKDSSKEWMLQGHVAFPNVSEVDWDHINDPVPDEVRKGFPEVGEQLKASFSENSPAKIECIVIISNIAEVSCDVHQNEKYLGIPVRGYVATSRGVARKEWEDSILLSTALVGGSSQFWPAQSGPMAAVP
jgi:hypothetical protein